MPFTPSYKGTSYELDESQVSKGRHREEKHKITVSLNEHGSERNETSVHKLKKKKILRLLFRFSVGFQVSKRPRGKGDLLKLNPQRP